jgi:hypothetical protein
MNVSPAGPLEIKVMQNDKTLTLSSATQPGDVRVAFALDGSETRTALTTKDAAIELFSRAAWNGDQLVITTTASWNGNAFASTTIFHLDQSGDLIAETVSTGGQPVARVSGTTRFKKVA